MGSKSYSKYDAIFSYYFKSHICSVPQCLSSTCCTMPELMNSLGSYLSWGQCWTGYCNFRLLLVALKKPENLQRKFNYLFTDVNWISKFKFRFEWLSSQILCTQNEAMILKAVSTCVPIYLLIQVWRKVLLHRKGFVCVTCCAVKPTPLWQKEAYSSCFSCICLLAQPNVFLH